MDMEELIELQGIDTKLKDLNDLLGDLPSKVEGLNKQEETIKVTIVDNKNRYKEVEVELHKKEVDIAQQVEKVNKLKDQLFLVTNNKQYDAIMNEMDHIKEKKSNFENETITLLEEKENLTKSIKDMSNELESLSDDLDIRREKLQAVILDSADEKSILEKQRQESILKIDEKIVSDYNRVMDARGGLAVVPLVGSGCGGCGAHIPPQVITELRANSGIFQCDTCRRFLYSKKLSVN